MAVKKAAAKKSAKKKKVLGKVKSAELSGAKVIEDSAGVKVVGRISIEIEKTPNTPADCSSRCAGGHCSSRCIPKKK